MVLFPEWRRRNAVLTCDANGIGAATVWTLRETGAQMLFCDRDDEAGLALASELRGGARFAEVSLLNEPEIARWIDSAGNRCGELHSVVNNAACDLRIRRGVTSSF